ncbi:MAG: hypothetical protein HY830_11075, partial [Actinobacteria bacterium]|nr:hypothetical protein [Actinomycetota bacterium]
MDDAPVGDTTGRDSPGQDVAERDLAGQPRVPPPGPRPRLRGVDAARGIALVGMVATHVWPG